MWGAETVTMQVVRFDQVTVVREGRAIVNNLTWEVREGERWVMLGPNGAGKTTALAIAAARAFPTSGTVDILGERLGAVDVFDVRPRIGIASPSLADRIPSEELVQDIVLTASYAVVGRHREEYDETDRQQARDQLDYLGIAHLAERTYGSLSEGERKRTQLARALMTDPELLVLDEPGAGLDLGGREDLLSRLTNLAYTPGSAALVMVTHHVEDIPVGFTHALLLRAGQTVAMGPIDEALTAQTLADTFGMRVTLNRYQGRYAARAEHVPAPGVVPGSRRGGSPFAEGPVSAGPPPRQ